MNKELLIGLYKARINLLQKRDEVMNHGIINKLKRKIRHLEAL